MPKKTDLSAVMETLKNAVLYAAEEIKFLPICSLAHSLSSEAAPQTGEGYPAV
jgi:hypothetical protein